MKKTSGVLLLLLTLLCLLSNGCAKKGFILTAPKTLDAGTKEHLTFTAFDLGRGTLSIRLLHWYTGELIANTTVHLVSSMSAWAELSLPPAPADQRARLHVEGVLGDGYRIDAAKEVLVRHSSVVTFVQTDKPLYRPGQTVRFRVLPLNSRLRPLGADTVADIWIEAPSNIRVSQWKKIQFAEGMIQLELPLSDEPPLGEWTIHTTVRQVTHAHKFSVSKYVLPKFDVKIRPPAFIMADADAIPLEICAWYSYDKKVDGTLRVKVVYKKYQWERKATPSVEQSGPISGCQTVHVNTQDILLQTREFGFRTLEFSAEVTENATGVAGNATAVREITHSPLKLQFLGADGNSDFFKPGIPFYGELSVHRPNDVPAPNERIEICASYTQAGDGPTTETYYPLPRLRVRRSFLPSPHRPRPASETHCKVFAADKKGRVRFSVPPKSRLHTQITLEACAVLRPPVSYGGRRRAWARSKLVRPSASLVLRPWHSPSGHQLQIEPRHEPVQCGNRTQQQLHRVRYMAANGTSLHFYHQVVSGGRIVQQGSHQRTHHPSGEEDSFDLGPADPRLLPMGDFLLLWDPREASASARLLVFHVRPDGEIVADSRKFRLRHCLDNKVRLRFRHARQYPNTDAPFLLSASPDSVCGIGLVDVGVSALLGGGRDDRQLDEDKIFRALEQFDVGREQAPHQVSEDYCMRKGEAGGVGPPPSRPFHHRLSRWISLHVDTAMAFEEAGVAVLSDFDLETRPCVESQPIAYNRIDSSAPDSSEEGAVFNLRVPSSRPPTPLMPKKAEEEEVEPPPPENTADEIRSHFPETWLWEMHTVGPSGEAALRRRLPHTLTRWVGGAVCVHAQTGLGVWSGAGITAFQPFFLSLTLPYSVVRGEGLPLPVTVFNYLSECLPIRLSLEPSPDFESADSRFHSLCVCGGESRTHRFVVRPKTLGRINVTVYGFSMEEDDACGGGEEEDGGAGVATARLGARDAVTREVEVEAEGFPKEETFNYFVCPETTNGSYATEVDLLLPEDVVEGSARAYVSVTGDLLGPSLLGLGQLVRIPVGCGEQNMVLFAPNVFVLEYLRSTDRLTGEVEEECLRNMKTGYQRELQYRHPDGSYSAFGPERDGGGSLWLTAFVVRSFGQARRLIDVDDALSALSARWILGRQFENGCFEPAGFLLNRAMKGGLSSSSEGGSLAPLTAYVLISLLESGAQRPEQPPVRSALSCLRSEPNPSSYALALFAYAALLAKEPAMAEKYFRQLESRATIKGSHQYWEDGGGGGASVGVETAAYFVLARMTQGGRDASPSVLPAVRWIVQQRNAHGGFVSTQDTVVALQALALYSSVQTRSRSSPLDMGLVVEGDDVVKGFKLGEGDRMVTRTASIPTLPAVLDLQAVGQGCALVQFSLRYNVAGTTVSEAFDLRVDVRREGSSCSVTPLTIGICMRYNISEQTSNMVVATVKMASGYTPDEVSLDKLQSDPAVQLMRHEGRDDRLHLYFSELTHAQKCFKFVIRRELEVDDIKPSSVKLFDYYQPELEVITEYSIPSICSTSSSSPLPHQMPSFPEPTIGSTRKTEASDATTSRLPGGRWASEDDNGMSETTTRLHVATSETSDTTHASEDEASRAERPSKEDEADEMTSEGFTSDAAEANGTPPTAAASEPARTEDDAAGNRDSEADEDAFRSGGGPPPIRHLGNFVEAEEDPNFPDGTEGNKPVYVRLPGGGGEGDSLPPAFLLTENTPILGCPVCSETFPGTFTDIYCSSALTLQIQMLDGISATIEYDLSHHLPQQQPIGEFATLNYDTSCPCHPLRENGSTLLVAGRSDLWDIGTQTLHLNKRTIIVSAHSTVNPLNCP